MSTLPTNLRRQLENTIRQARKIAEGGARKALEALAVHEPDPYRHMDAAQRELRRKLRAQAKQLGDRESQTKRGGYEIKHLVEKLAYDQWHRLLFARFLLDNNLLISPDHMVSVSLDDCEELAQSCGLKDAWAVAARFAANELPEIFRSDDPVGAVDFPIEDRKPLIQLVTGLPAEVFTASDSLGWCYQFWQAERKDEVNAAGNKIGADELPAVTQLFTEDYMVDFLLDNTLGAWQAGKVLAADPKLAENAKNEDELWNAVALPGCPWKYLRFIKAKDGKWTPAAGTFSDWPKAAKELTCLDPCMGSGHFLVAMFERLVALRMAEEKLDEAAAVGAVIRDNLFGLEIDPRCTQIAAFNLAMGAWRRVGHCTLPMMHLACSGLAPNAKKDDWLRLAGDNEKLRNGMDRLYRLFKDAAVLGSLINPRAVGGDLLEAEFHELQPLMEKALAKEDKDDHGHEMAVTARGLAKAAEILAGQFTLVATNVPYLVKAKQSPELRSFCESYAKDASADLATVFLDRCGDFCATNGGTHSTVTPQNWLFLKTYSAFRRRLLTNNQFCHVTAVGSGATATTSWDVLRALAIVTVGRGLECSVTGIETEAAQEEQRASDLKSNPLICVSSKHLIENPDSRIALAAAISQGILLARYADSLQGISTGDNARFQLFFWEATDFSKVWGFQQGTVSATMLYGGREKVIRWENGKGAMSQNEGSAVRGLRALGYQGVSITQMRSLPTTIFSGSFFDTNVAVILPKDHHHFLAIWTYCSSPEFLVNVRRVDKKLNVTNATFGHVPFDLAHWQKMAAKKYPHGLPKPFSSDPTQWLFNGDPKGSDQPLHVAVARLLGYEWPRQTGSSFPDCPALGPDSLEKLSDEDGIVCLSATKGEAPAAERLRELLARAFGKEWNTTKQDELLAQVDYAGASLEDWLRNGFFEQHCVLFQHRPFIWHVWDGLKNGFSALMNYHKVTHANLEKLTYAYLGDWIRRQQAAVDAGEAGSDAKLQAAKQLQSKLKLILEGEPPYDLFVRWKPLSKQAIGWRPDLNDGVRLNIRPFATADILRKRVKIKWDKDRGKEPARDKKEFPWFWGWDEQKHDFTGGRDFDGNRWNDCHYTGEFKNKRR